MKNRVILFQFLAISLMAYFLFQKPYVEKKVETVEKIVRVTDTVFSSKPTKIKEVVVYVEKDRPLKAKKHIYKDTINSAFLTSTITADNIYSRKVDLVLHEKQIKTKVTKTAFKPRIYIGNSFTIDENRSFKNITLEANLATKKFLIGGGFGFDSQQKGFIFPIRLGYKF